MNELPDPLVPAGIDLSGYDYMPLYVTRLRKSRTWVRCKRRPAHGFYLMNMWTEAFTSHERAGSLPDDDDLLADAAMCAPDDWESIKADIMTGTGWILCNDGRWYHPVVAEVVIEVWEKSRKTKTQTKSATEAAAEARRTKREAKIAEANGTQTDDAMDHASDRNGTGTDTVPDDGQGDNGIRQASVTDSQRNSINSVTQSVADGNGLRQPSVTETNRNGNLNRKQPPPTPAAKPARAVSAEVVAVVNGFLASREKHFPGDSRLPANQMTLETQAAQYVAKGAPVALLLETVERGMVGAAEDARQFGKPPPISLSAFNLSLDTEIAKFRKAQAGPPPDSRPRQGATVGPAVAADAEVARWRQRLTRYRASRIWEDRWGPPPGKPRCMAPKALVDEILGAVEAA
ncbi:DUF1376 domain-containing protein [Azospirillum sp. Vi22]|uniref:DUF1376 domain-containing protein n=1 Tax=Azospirillum baldaniorum TaxID=1064539 RepID=UPI00157A4EB6|nr:DUF1376 domain-containing protein [Azospirillum baldaniorum]NUB05867.1 DUF1376 domain-containing protein [Azospirillum baldaniorum]